MCLKLNIYGILCPFYSPLFNKTLFLKMNKQESEREKERKRNLHGRQTKTVLLITDCLRISSSIFNLLIFSFSFVFTWGTIESFSSRKTMHMHMYIQVSDCFSFSSFKRNEWAGSLLLRRTLEYVCTRRLTSMGCQVHHILSFSHSLFFFFYRSNW